MHTQHSSGNADVCLYLGSLFESVDSTDCETGCSGLRRFMSRASQLRIPVTDSLSFVHWVAGVGQPDWPAAAICRFADTGQTDNSWWLCADPVHLEPAGDTLVLRHVPQQAASAAVEELLDRLAAHLAQDGWQLEAPNAQPWYLRAPFELKCQTTPTEIVHNADVYEFMPRGEHGRRLRSVMNDIQMLVFSLSGQTAPRVNSVWLWGQGRWRQELPEPAGPVPPGYAAHPYLRGLWRHWGLDHGLPGDCAGQLESGGGLVAMPHFKMGAQGIETLEKDWLGPLLESLNAGLLHSISLVLRHGICLRLTRKALRSFWHRQRPLTATLPALRPSSSDSYPLTDRP